MFESIMPSNKNSSFKPEGESENGDNEMDDDDMSDRLYASLLSFTFFFIKYYIFML